MLNKVITHIVLIVLLLTVSIQAVSYFSGEFNFVEIAYAADEPKKDPLGSFDVSTYLKIKEGQTYLEEDSKTGETAPTLQKGVFYFLVTFIELLTRVIGSFALLLIIAGGLVLMLSHGNQGMQTKGKDMIKYALLGLVVAFASLIIVTFVQSLFFTA